jgi:hypothetical protein
MSAIPTLYAHFDFYDLLFAEPLSVVLWLLTLKGYDIECYPDHCEEKPLPYVLASMSEFQKVKVHFDFGLANMIEVREDVEGGHSMYKKLLPGND